VSEFKIQDSRFKMGRAQDKKPQKTGEKMIHGAARTLTRINNALFLNLEF
jgi:hypothetical protein